ncbi:MAG: hypothetical protein RI580_14305 [Halothece sp. Uz-M2-17]|nr:hypothetical protein [Halothece sp. Uz-M2-17]
MAKQQINFRIDPVLLQKIKDRAQQEGVSYTQWIINACLSQLADDPRITVEEEEEIDPFHPTEIHYSESNIQYSGTALQATIQDWEQTESEHNKIEDTLPKAQQTVFQDEQSLQDQINHLSNRLHWESQYRQALETQVYYLKSILVEKVAALEAKITLIEQQSQSKDPV